MYLYEKTHESGQITVRLVAYSSADNAPNIATFELEYPRFIHSELMTHRVFSRNAMSSRAVPIAKMIEQVRTNPAMPIHWGANQAGMQADVECSNSVEFDWICGEQKCGNEVDDAWQEAADRASDIAEALSKAGYHKQIVNRILEPYQRMKTIVTSTEWDNFFELRCHKDAQPEIKVLAEMMRDIFLECEPEFLGDGEWHTPYVDHWKSDNGDLMYGMKVDKGAEDYPIKWLTEQDALKVSASCCAQVSYRLLDNSLDKALMVYDRLVSSKPIHASPFEHQGRVMKDTNSHVAHPMDDIDGVTHQDVNGNYWSGNFKGWIQYRQLLG